MSRYLGLASKLMKLMNDFNIVIGENHMSFTGATSTAVLSHTN